MAYHGGQCRAPTQQCNSCNYLIWASGLVLHPQDMLLCIGYWYVQSSDEDLLSELSDQLACFKVPLKFARVTNKHSRFYTFFYPPLISSYSPSYQSLALCSSTAAFSVASSLGSFFVGVVR
jgi:hypothetical protein